MRKLLCPQCKVSSMYVNTWANALRGADQDKAPFEGIWTNAKFRLPGDGLLPAGWMGPCEFFKTKE